MWVANIVTERSDMQRRRDKCMLLKLRGGTRIAFISTVCVGPSGEGPSDPTTASAVGRVDIHRLPIVRRCLSVAPHVMTRPGAVSGRLSQGRL
jgi:hypothetical protein